MISPDGASVQTRLIGGNDGAQFNDSDAVSGWPAANKIRRDHPISKIDIFTGWIVDGITVTYDLADGTQKAVQHGSKTVTATVTLSDTEVIADVSGMAGYHNYYKKALVCTISFNILDTKTGIMRVAGPYGNSDKANAGQPYHFSGPFVFAGFADNAAEHVGLSGLSVIRSTLWE